MRVQRVITNETCNQDCWFCNGRRPKEDPDFVARTAVGQRIEVARAGETREIVLTGGEPTLRNDVANLIRRAGKGGARVVLETNAALVDEARARELACAGLGLARVQLVAWGEDADAITRDPGGFSRSVDGIRVLDAAGVAVEVTLPIVRRNLSLAAHVPAEIAKAKLPVAALVVLVPTSAPDPGECASIGEIEAAVLAVADAGRKEGVTVRLDTSTFVPPCILEKAERFAHLFALNRGNATRSDFEHIDACESCLVADRCPGMPGAALSEEAAASLHPVTDQRLRRRLTVVSSIEEQVARELCHREVIRNDHYGQVPEYTVRVNSHCNQACEFCFVSTHLPPPAEAAVRDAIEAVGNEQAVVVLSGGEPTLNPLLVEYVQLAKDRGAPAIELQSNAIRLAGGTLAQSLAKAGLDLAMVSLHGSTAEISDRITAAPGTFDATPRGIDALSQTSVRVRLNFVFCRASYQDFPRFIDLVAERWPTATIVFSLVGSHTDVVPRTTALIPSFSDVLPPLLAGLSRARAAGIEVCGFDSMCGLPLCLVPENERAAFSNIPVSPDGGGAEFVKAESRLQCSEAYRCYGVRRSYAELYDTGELRPLLVEEHAAQA